MQVRLYTSLDALPPAYAALFEDPRHGTIFLSRPWLANYLATGIEPGDRPCLYGAEGDGSHPAPLGLLVGFVSRLYTDHPRARVLAFHQFDGVPLTPHVAPTATSPRTVLEAIIPAIGAARPPYDVLRFSPLDPASTLYAELVEILRRAGLIVRSYHNFTNWFEVTAGLSARDYLQRRSSNVRHNLRRRARRLERAGGVRFDLIVDRANAERGISDCARISAGRRVRDEPLPMRYIWGAVRTAAEAGALRLGMLHVDGQPAAFQFCIASAGGAYFLRTGYDERFRHLSVGSLVIQRTMEHVLDVDTVREVDFGIGDYPYKKDWAADRRDRRGIVAFNPRTVRGLKNALRHMAAQTVKRALAGLPRRVGPLVNHRRGP